MKWSNSVLAAYASQPKMTARDFDAKRMPFAMSAMGMCMSAAASAIIIKTGVFTPVFSFVVVLLIVSLLLVGLVTILSLLLTSLIGLVRLKSLVRQVKKLATSSTQGD